MASILSLSWLGGGTSFQGAATIEALPFTSFSLAKSDSLQQRFLALDGRLSGGV